MNEKAEQIRAALIKVLGLDKPVIITGTVESVDEAAWTCKVVCANGLVIADAHLKALKEAAKGAVLVPKANTTVWLQSIGAPDWLVISIEEVDKVFLNAETETTVTVPKLYINADTETVFNGGNNGGIPIVNEIKNNLESLKDFVMEMHNAIPSAFTKVGAGSSASGPTGASDYTTNMIGKKIDFKDMENKKVKH